MRTKRWLYAVNGIVALLFLGLIYAWSVFVGPLEAEFGWLRSETSLTFSISMAFFCLGGLGGGILSKKVSARIVLLAGAVCIAAGFCAASFIGSLAGLYICYGVVCSFGVGLGYNASLNGVLRWFPDKQGAVSGALLMGFGFGGMVLGSAAVWLMNVYDWRIAFRVLGITLGALLALLAIVMRQPTAAQLEELGAGRGKAQQTPVEDVPAGRMIRQRAFIVYFLWAGLFTAAGLGIISNATSFAGSFTGDLAQAAFIAGLLNIFNGAGRVVGGVLFDLIGSKKCLWLFTGGLLCAMLVLMGAVASGSVVLLVVGFIMAGLFYGGVPPFNSAWVARVYGPKHYPMNISVVNLQILLASFIGPYTAGLAQTASGGYFSTAALMAVVCVLCFGLLFLLNRHVPGSLQNKKNAAEKPQ